MTRPVIGMSARSTEEQRAGQDSSIPPPMTYLSISAARAADPGTGDLARALTPVGVAPQGIPSETDRSSGSVLGAVVTASRSLPCVRSAKPPKLRSAGSPHGSLPGMMGRCWSHW